jgi:PAS domain S-box-containing protein
VVDWNLAASILFGYSKRDVLGRSINLIFQTNYAFPKIIQELQNKLKLWREETTIILHDGKKGFCQTALTLCPQPTTQKPLFLMQHQDITAYKAQEEQLEILKIDNHITQLGLLKSLSIREILEKSLRESELRFHLLAENSTDLISRHHPDGTYLYASPSCKTLLGYSPEELVGCNAYKYLHYDDVGKLRKAMNRRKNISVYYTVTYRIRRKEGDYRWFESNVRIIRDEGNHLVKEIQTASRDVTNHVLDKKARLRGQQLAHVFRLSTMEEMASGMAHEISQPLAAVVNYTQGCVRYLKKETLDSTQLVDAMNKAVAQAERAGEVIHRLKNFFCKGQLVKTPCKINSLIRETVSLIRNELNIAKTKIEFNLNKNVPLIIVDRIQLQQVILNLIQNAVEAIKEADQKYRKIAIHTKTNNQNSIEIFVNDSGPGFSKELVHKVFEPFFSTKAHGRGMGLAICRSIVEAHGGEFTINPNTHTNSGIKFILPTN